MNAKEYLNQNRLVDIKLNNKIAEKELLRSVSEKLHYIPERNEKGEFAEKVGSLPKKIIEIDAEIDSIIVEAIDLKHEIIAKVESIQDHRFYDILHKHYIMKNNIKNIKNTY